MADYASSLPIRTESDGDAVVKICDKTTTANQLKVNTDGSISIDDNGASITVDGTVELGATSLAALESITVQNGAGGSAVNIQDGGNSITVDGTVELGATSLAALESITVQNGAGGSAVNIQDGGNSITVDATALDIRPLIYSTDNVAIKGSTGNQLVVNADGSINASITSTVGGTAIHNYQTDTVAASGTATHDYTVTALKTLNLSRVWASSSGKIKVEAKLETAPVSGIFNTFFVGFNSTANPNIDFTVASPASVAAGVRVRVIRTNLDKGSEDIYTTIEGTEI